MPHSLTAGHSQALGVMTKHWVPGMVKTRLIPAIGCVAAAELHRAMAGYTLRCLDHCGTKRLVAISPASAVAEVSRMAGPRWRVTTQSDGGLGRRIGDLLCTLMADADRAVIVGTDCPPLSATLVDEALRRLGEEKVVMGPASDGGYYLIGVRGPWDDSMRALFDAIPWGTDGVAAKTIAAARECGWSVGRLAMLSDVDRPEDLPNLVRWIDQGNGDPELQRQISEVLRGTQ